MAHADDDAAVTHLPPIDRTWSIGSVISAACSLGCLIVVTAGIIWNYAHVDAAVLEHTKDIPALRMQQDINTQNIAVLTAQQKFSDGRFGEILNRLTRLDDKMDHLREVDKKP